MQNDSVFPLEDTLPPALESKMGRYRGKCGDSYVRHKEVINGS